MDSVRSGDREGRRQNEAVPERRFRSQRSIQERFCGARARHVRLHRHVARVFTVSHHF
jgi:hypothetical protein